MQNTHSFGKNAVISELAKQGFSVSHIKGGLLANDKTIEVKCCNSDNEWVKSQKILGGWDRIDPVNFDNLVCAVFDDGFDWIRYFIFSQSEVREFPKAVWKDAPESRNLTLVKGEERTDEIVKSSENVWNKILSTK